MTNHISFTDKQAYKYVGQVREYSIRAIQSITGLDADNRLTSMSIAPYRIPYLAKLSGMIETKSNAGVGGVTINICHIDPITGKKDTRDNKCPFIQFTSDQRGSFNGDIRVSDILWNNMIEYFNVTAEFTELMSDGTVLEHVFDPPFQILKIGQLGTVNIKFIDETEITIFGSVKFDPAIVDSYDCPFAGVPVNLVDSKGNLRSTYSASDGSFNFSLTHRESATVYIPDFNGYQWQSLITSLSGIPSMLPTSMPSKPTIVPTIVSKNGPKMVPRSQNDPNKLKLEIAS